MPHNYKFHAIAIAIICIIVVFLYAVIGPGSQRPTILPGQTAQLIAIASASWGVNCNEQITLEQQQRATQPIAKDENGVLIPTRPLTPIAPNNVLETVSNICNGLPACELKVTSSGLGVEDPISSCFKNLTVKYRCFSFDRLWDKTANQGTTLKIDCNETAAPARK